jgi:hypothetical protein
MAILRNANIIFHTNDEDKDDDTNVTVNVFDSDGVLAARIQNDFGHFNDHSESGPYALIIHNPSLKSVLQNGNVTIRIDPNGNDTWRFNFLVDLVFDDGTHLSANGDGLELTEERQEQSFGISGIVRSS